MIQRAASQTPVKTGVDSAAPPLSRFSSVRRFLLRCVVSCLLCASETLALASEVRRYDIAASSLSEALIEIALQSDRQVLSAYEVVASIRVTVHTGEYDDA